jgi:prefoldin subunit 5
MFNYNGSKIEELNSRIEALEKKLEEFTNSTNDRLDQLECEKYKISRFIDDTLNRLEGVEAQAGYAAGSISHYHGPFH